MQTFFLYFQLDQKSRGVGGGGGGLPPPPISYAHDKYLLAGNLVFSFSCMFDLHVHDFFSFAGGEDILSPWKLSVFLLLCT